MLFRSEEEQRQDRLAKKRESLEKKTFDASLDGMTDEQKVKALQDRAADLFKKQSDTTDEEEILDLYGERLELLKQAQQIQSKTTKDKTEVQASSLAKIGGGGGAFLVKQADAAERNARAAEEQTRLTKDEIREIKKLGDKIDARWSP